MHISFMYRGGHTLLHTCTDVMTPYCTLYVADALDLLASSVDTPVYSLFTTHPN